MDQAYHPGHLGEFKRLRCLLILSFSLFSVVSDVYFENAEWAKNDISHHPLNYFGTSRI